MPEVKVHYRFTGEKRSFYEVDILPAGTNVEAYYKSYNLNWNSDQPEEQPYREIVQIDIVNAWKHHHDFAKVRGFEYYQCNLCGCKAAWNNERWNRLQGWEEEEFEHCYEKPPKLPKLKVSNITPADVEIEDLTTEQKSDLKQIKPFTL